MYFIANIPTAERRDVDFGSNTTLTAAKVGISTILRSSNCLWPHSLIKLCRLVVHTADVQGELSLKLMISQRSPENQN